MLARETGWPERGTMMGCGGPAGAGSAGLAAARDRNSFEKENK
jgi:hypothetical protein